MYFKFVVQYKSYIGSTSDIWLDKHYLGINLKKIVEM